jgi:hypothetical protein
MYGNLKKLKLKGGIVIQIFHKLKDFKRMILVLFSFLLVINIISFCFILPKINDDKLTSGTWYLYPSIFNPYKTNYTLDFGNHVMQSIYDLNYVTGLTYLEI